MEVLTDAAAAKDALLRSFFSLSPAELLLQAAPLLDALASLSALEKISIVAPLLPTAADSPSLSLFIALLHTRCQEFLLVDRHLFDWSFSMVDF